MIRSRHPAGPPPRMPAIPGVAGLLLGFGLVFLAACDGHQSSAAVPASAAQAQPAVPPSGPTEPEPPTYTYRVVNTWPHDRGAFTQGLIYLKGVFFESTGLNGQSTLRRVEPQTGRVLQQVTVPAQYFAEGMTELGGKIFQLTWQNQKGFVYDLGTFAPLAEFSYTGEGWGLTTDGQSLIMSDGTEQIRFLDPATFRVTRTIRVIQHGQPLKQLNELEYVKGEIFANLWQTQLVVRIDPANGRVLGMIDFSGLLSAADYARGTDVLNGIAYDAAGDRLFITGKNWPKLFEVQLRRK